MAERQSIRQYASFDVAKKGYARNQVDEFLADVDKAVGELEELLAHAQRRIHVLEQQATGDDAEEADEQRTEDIVGRAEAQARVAIEEAQARAKEILAMAEAQAMRLVTEARDELSQVEAAGVVDEDAPPPAVEQRFTSDRRSGGDRRRPAASWDPPYEGEERRIGGDRRTGKDRRRGQAIDEPLLDVDSPPEFLPDAPTETISEAPPVAPPESVSPSSPHEVRDQPVRSPSDIAPDSEVDWKNRRIRRDAKWQPTGEYQDAAAELEALAGHVPDAERRIPSPEEPGGPPDAMVGDEEFGQEPASDYEVRRRVRPAAADEESEDAADEPPPPTPKGDGLERDDYARRAAGLPGSGADDEPDTS